jgi:hypothetical protein
LTLRGKGKSRKRAIWRKPGSAEEVNNREKLTEVCVKQIVVRNPAFDDAGGLKHCGVLNGQKREAFLETQCALGALSEFVESKD